MPTVTLSDFREGDLDELKRTGLRAAAWGRVQLAVKHPVPLAQRQLCQDLVRHGSGLVAAVDALFQTQGGQAA